MSRHAKDYGVRHLYRNSPTLSKYVVVLKKIQLVWMPGDRIMMILITIVSFWVRKPKANQKY